MKNQMESIGGMLGKHQSRWDIQHHINAVQAMEKHTDPLGHNAPEMGGFQIHYVEVL